MKKEEEAELDLTMSSDSPNNFRRSPRLLSAEQRSSSSSSSKRVAKLTDCNNSDGKQSNKKRVNASCISFLIGDPIPEDEARRRWPYRYQNKRQRSNHGKSSAGDDDEDELVLNVKCHYSQAEIVKCVFDLGDCAYVKGEKRKKNFVGRIVEFFKTMDDEDYFRVQWFFRAEDTGPHPFEKV